jgi:Uma2 family endonuclease
MTEPLYDLPSMSLEEYLAFEEASDAKHEFVEGFVYAMSGAHSRHERIAGNVLAHVWMAARGGSCRVYGSRLKVRAPTNRIYYPDVMSVCTPRDDAGSIVDDPCLVVEVTSPSTSRTDHREKLEAYTRIEALQSYLIVEQNRREVHRWWRDASGGWQHEMLTQRGSIGLPCPSVTLTLDEIYEGVTMPPPQPLRVREPGPAHEECLPAG